MSLSSPLQDEISNFRLSFVEFVTDRRSVEFEEKFIAEWGEEIVYCG